MPPTRTEPPAPDWWPKRLPADAKPPKVCPCSYCKAVRSGKLPPVQSDSAWLRRMGGAPR